MKLVALQIFCWMGMHICQLKYANGKQINQKSIGGGVVVFLQSKTVNNLCVQLLFQINDNNFRAIINHTMLQNSTSLCQAQQSPHRLHSASNLLIFHTLYKEVEEHKLSLSRALAINQFLVHQASVLEAVSTPAGDSSANDHNFALKAVKMEDCEEYPSQRVEIRVRKQTKKRGSEDGEEESHDKNETKNIPKNYGKAILSFIQKNIQKYLGILKPILQRGKLTINDLLLHIKKHKKEVNSINYLKEMWGYQDRHNPILKCIRILSYVFMRKHCLSYIFNSRVKNYSTHIKYRTRIIEGIENPEEFTCIKQF